jgi:hypothetical protein
VKATATRKVTADTYRKPSQEDPLEIVGDEEGEPKKEVADGRPGHRDGSGIGSRKPVVDASFGSA